MSRWQIEYWDSGRGKNPIEKWLDKRRYGYRVYYGFRGEYMIVLLIIGDKKSQQNDIKVARDRLLQV